MPQPTPPPAAEPPPKRARPPAETPPPVPDAAAPKPPEEGAIFRALLDAGADAVVAYTAEKRLDTMISDAIAPQLQSFVREMSRRLDEHDRKLDALDAAGAARDRTLDKLDALAAADAAFDRKLDALAAADAAFDRKLDALAAAGAARDRKIDVLVAQTRLLLAAMGLLVTVLIAGFGFLFTR